MPSQAGQQLLGRARWARPPRKREPAAGFNLATAMDGLTEFAVLAFASWTLLYDIGSVTRLGTSVLLALWAACLVASAAGLVRFRGAQAEGEAARVSHARSLTAATPWRRRLAVAGMVLGVAAGLAVGLHRIGLPWYWTWTLGALAVAATLTWLLAPDEEASAAAGRSTGAMPAASARAGAAGRWESLLALCTAVAAAVFSLYVVRPDADDAFFVSRAVWTAQHGRIAPLKDVIFTSQAVKQVTSESPISSVEVLLGALARLFGVSGASFTYYIALPVFTFFAVWAVWLLIRRWAPGRHALCFGVAMVYLALSGTSGASFGSFHLVRMWQGKAAFVSVMVPLLYAYLTQWAEHRSRRNSVLVAAAGIAAAGLTSSAALVVPLIAAAVAAPLLLAGGIAAAVGAVLAAVYPVAAGLVVAVFFPVSAQPHGPFAASTAWEWVLLPGVLGGIGGVALWTAPWLARRGAPALITTGVAGVATVLLIPGVLAVIGNSTGTNAVAYRTMWVVPGPVVVGLLAAVPLPHLGRLPLRSAVRWIAVVPAVTVAAVILAAGRPVWSPQNVIHAILAPHPSWKYDPLSLSLARKALRADHQAGYLLSTGRIMGAVPLLTSKVRAVNPRTFYLDLLPVSAQFRADRVLLTRLAGQQLPMPTESAVRAALTRVPVGYACLWSHNTDGLRLLEQAGFAPARHFGGLRCLQR